MRIVILLAALALATESPVSDPWLTHNAHVVVHDRWAALRNARVNDPAKVGTISVPELRLWEETKASWLTFQRAQDAEYR